VTLATHAWYYRGGRDLRPRPHDVKIDSQTGQLRTGYGISVYDNPARVARFGGAFRLDGIPEGLKVIQRGRDPEHFEVGPAYPMTLDEYADLLAQVTLTEVAVGP
jgi:hypothetical protein